MCHKITQIHRCAQCSATTAKTSRQECHSRSRSSGLLLSLTRRCPAPDCDWVQYEGAPLTCRLCSEGPWVEVRAAAAADGTIAEESESESEAGGVGHGDGGWEGSDDVAGSIRSGYVLVNHEETGTCPRN